jgi:hypothetical protein
MAYADLQDQTRDDLAADRSSGRRQERRLRRFRDARPEPSEFREGERLFGAVPVARMLHAPNVPLCLGSGRKCPLLGRRTGFNLLRVAEIGRCVTSIVRELAWIVTPWSSVGLGFDSRSPCLSIDAHAKPDARSRHATVQDCANAVQETVQDEPVLSG